MNDTNVRRIVVGVDGSEHSAGALAWAIPVAQAMGAEIVAACAIPDPSYYEYGMGFGTAIPPVEFDPEWTAAMRRDFEELWCKPLRDAGMPYRAILRHGRPATVIAEIADRENADLVAVGRRGRGSVAEILLGSVSHELSHICRRPLTIISATAPVAERPLEAATAATA